jgi:poly(hydroxyalkanoate) granule-associated protein
MVTKRNANSASSGDSNKQGRSDSNLAAAVKDSAQQIWLAGLGAFAKAQEEGTKVFEALVKEGTGIHKRTRHATEEKFGEVTGKVTKVAGEITKQANESWDKLEQVFEDRVARALNRLGVPTNKDVQALIARVEELNTHVVALTGAPRASKTAAKTARKSTRSVVKKSAKAAPKKVLAIVAAATTAGKKIARKTVKAGKAK